jgi:Uncharacterized MobA-related protein
MRLAAVILSAGKSSRLPRFKPLLDLGGGSFLARAAQLFREAGVQDILAVTGTRAGEVAAHAQTLGMQPVFNPDHEDGMFTSVRAGFTALSTLPLASEPIAGVFVLPVDIPLIRPATVRALVVAFHPADHEVLLPTYRGEPGHPPLIAAAAVPGILAWKGSGGLAGALSGLRCAHRAVADSQILFDVDDDAAAEEAERRLVRWPEPTPAEAEELMTLCGAGERGLAHGRGVARAALLLARAINAFRAQGGAGRGRLLDLELVEAAALVHDIAKGQPDHERAGAQYLAGLGYARTASIVAAHRDIDPEELAGPEAVGERELVYLADKLVRGPYRVDIAQRFQEKLDSYAGNVEAVAAIHRRLGHAQGMARLVEQGAGRSLEAILDQ